jgi:hypothetical protein
MDTNSAINFGSKVLELYGIPGVSLIAFFITCYFLFKYFSEALKRKDELLENRAKSFSDYVAMMEEKRNLVDKINFERIVNLTDKFDKSIHEISYDTRTVLVDLKEVISDLRNELSGSILVPQNGKRSKNTA